MHFGASMFFTDYSMTPTELGPGARGARLRIRLGGGALAYSDLAAVAWGGGGDLPKQYYDVMDPFVTLTAAAVATKTLKLGTGVCLVNQRDTIQTAKLVASIDQVSGGRFLFGIGIGWNAEEMEDHGTVVRDARQAGARAGRGDEGDLDQAEGGISRRAGQLPGDDGLAQAGAEAASAGHRRRRLSAGGAARGALRRRLDPAGRAPRPVRRRVRLRAEVSRRC